MRIAIDDELSRLPYVNDLFVELLFSSAQITHHSRMSIIYIEGFFTDGRDFAFYVIGQTHFTKFVVGMDGLQPYDGPLIATLIIFAATDALDCHVRRTKLLDQHGPPAVMRKDGTRAVMKWRYLFRTAQLAWKRLRFDGKKVLKARLHLAPRLQKGIDDLAAQMREIEQAQSQHAPAHPGQSADAVGNASMSEKKREKMKDPGPSGDPQALQKHPALLALAIL